MRSFALRGICLGLLAVASACGAETPAPEAVSTAPAVREEPPFVEGLPRDQWLVQASAKPLAEDGSVVRDEKRRPYSYELLGSAVPAFNASWVGGSEATEEVFRGKWTIVDVWGIWCGDCRRDIDFVKDLAAKADADPELDFLSIHTPPSQSRADEAYGQFGSVEAYFQSIGGGYPTIIDQDASLRDLLRIRWTPSYLLVGPDLTVQAFRTDISIGGEGSVDRVLQQARDIRAAAGL